MTILSRRDVEELLDLNRLIDNIAIAMADLSSGRASMPPRIAAEVADRHGILGAMPAFVPALNVLAAKLVTLFPENAGSPVPTHQAVIVAFDPASGSPLALMDGTYITAMRTAAASALATKLLARPDATTVAILGTGVQAKAHARLITMVRPIEKMWVAGRNPEKARRVASEIEAECGIETKPAVDWQDAISRADIVCATVHPIEPVVRGEWLRPGLHINSVGVSSHGAEVDFDAIGRSRVFLEMRSIAQSPMPSGSNELFQAVSQGAIALDDISEIGEVVSGKRPGRGTPEDVTLYKSVGVAVQDAAAAALVLEAASRLGVQYQKLEI